jgi:hypothetical protein
MELRKVKAGFTDGSDVEILEGLNQNDTIYVKAGA